MSSSAILSTLKAAQLKHAAFLLGLATTGTKLELEHLIRSRAMAPPVATGSSGRIVSIDMGIRNLGICVVEAPCLTHHTEAKSRVPRNTPEHEDRLIKVVAWKKMDVVQALSSQTPTPLASQETGTDAGSIRSKKKPTPTSTATYTPSSLAKVAHSLTTSILTTYHPEHILIERQRFRSGGAAAVLEWTLRVNVLESMLWASIETYRQSAQFYKAHSLGDRGDETVRAAGRVDGVHEISPARVARFWCSDVGSGGTGLRLSEEGLLTPLLDERATSVLTRSRKIEKSDKIAVVRRWLQQTQHDEATDDVRLDLGDEAREVAEAFLTPAGRKAAKGGIGEIGKLDDLADCLLQATAWVKWEQNRLRMGDIMRDRKHDTGRRSERPEEPPSRIHILT